MPRFRDFLYAQAIMNTAVWVADILSIAFYAVAMRLPSAAFAEIRVVAAVGFVASVGQLAMRNFVLLRLRERSTLFSAVNEALSAGAIIAGVLFVMVGLGSPFIAAFLHFDSYWPFVFVAITAVPAVITGVGQGILSSKQKFLPLALSLITEALIRFPLGYAFFTENFSSDDIGTIILMASTAACAVTLFAGWNVWPKGNTFRFQLPSRDARWTTVAMIGSSLFLGMAFRVDIIWSKHSLAPDDAGVYGFLALIAGVLFIGTSGVARAAVSYMLDRKSRRVQAWSAWIIVLAASAGAAIFFLTQQWVLPIIAPTMPKIDDFALTLLFIAMTCFCLIHWFFQYLSILHRNVHVLLSACLLCFQVLLFGMFGYSIRMIAFGQLLAMTIFTVLFFMAQHRLSRARHA